MSLNKWSSRSGMRLGVVVAATILAIVAAPAQTLEPLPAPAGPVILTVSGNIEATNGEAGATFDREMLYGLGLTEITTTTPWTDGPQVFSGVLARTVFERVGADGAIVLASALNDYTVEVPIEDFEKYDVLLATEMNGEEMKVSDKGPVWIVYPRDNEPELQDRRLHDRWVWQLKELRVQ